MSAAEDAAGAQNRVVGQQPTSANGPSSAAAGSQPHGGGSSTGGAVRVRKNRFAGFFDEDRPEPAAAASAPVAKVSAPVASAPALGTGAAAQEVPGARAGPPTVPRGQNGQSVAPSSSSSSSSSSDSSSASTR